MFQEKRPTCVTVIGWAWITIGGFTCLSAIMGLRSFGITEWAQEVPDRPFMFRIFPWLVILQIGLSVLGLVSGINFLKLKAWARPVLEALTWFLFVFILGSMGLFFFIWRDMTSEHGADVVDVVFGIMGVVMTGVYVVPVGIMLKSLRGPTVRNAINGTAEQTDTKSTSETAPSATSEASDA